MTTNLGGVYMYKVTAMTTNFIGADLYKVTPMTTNNQAFICVKI